MATDAAGGTDHARYRLSRTQRFVLLVGAANVVLIVGGVGLVPATIRSWGGAGSLVADVAMQMTIAGLALAGPWSLRGLGSTVRVSVALALVFAAVYTGVLLLEFSGVQTNANILALFVGVAVAAGCGAGYQTRRWRPGVTAAIWALLIGTAVWSTADLLINYVLWDSPQQYRFMLMDGAVDEFRRSGSADFNLFVLRDLQGALFFHPVLSVVVGTVGGLSGSLLAQGLLALARAVRPAADDRPDHSRRA